MRITIPEGRRSALTRLAAMPGQKRVAGALAVAAAAVVISACGSSSGSNPTIPSTNATELNAALNGVEAAVNQGKCNRAQTEAQNFIDAVNQLPDTVGTTDKEALRSAGENLQKLAQQPSQCKQTPTGASGFQGDQSTSTSTTPEVVPTTTTTATTSTTSTTTEPPSSNGGGNQGGNESGGGPPSVTPPGQGNTGGGGGETGGGGGQTGGGGAAGGGGGTGSGGTGVGGGGGGTG